MKELESNADARLALLKETIYIRSIQGHQSDYTNVMNSYERTRKEVEIE